MTKVLSSELPREFKVGEVTFTPKDYHDQKWGKKLEGLKPFYEEHRHCNILKSNNDGLIDKNIEKWLANQRQAMNAQNKMSLNKEVTDRAKKLALTMSPHRRTALESLGVKAYGNDEIWKSYVEKFKEYKDNDSNFDISDLLEKGEEGKSIYHWASRIKTAYRMRLKGETNEKKMAANGILLNETRFAMLQEAGFPLEDFQNKVLGMTLPTPNKKALASNPETEDIYPEEPVLPKIDPQPRLNIDNLKRPYSALLDADSDIESDFSDKKMPAVNTADQESSVHSQDEVNLGTNTNFEYDTEAGISHVSRLGTNRSSREYGVYKLKRCYRAGEEVDLASHQEKIKKQRMEKRTKSPLP